MVNQVARIYEEDIGPDAVSAPTPAPKGGRKQQQAAKAAAQAAAEPLEEGEEVETPVPAVVVEAVGGGGGVQSAARKLQLLEFSSYLEAYLWPFFDQVGKKEGRSNVMI